MAKQRAFRFSDEAEKILVGIQERTGDSLTKVVEKGLYYYAKHLNRKILQEKSKKAPKSLLDLDLDTVEPYNVDVPLTLNLNGIDSYGRKQRKTWTISDVKQLIKFREQGTSLDMMASYLGRPKSSISKKLWELKQKDQ